MRRGMMMLAFTMLFAFSVVDTMCAAEQYADVPGGDHRLRLGVFGGMGIPMEPISNGWDREHSFGGTIKMAIRKGVELSLSVSEDQFQPKSENFTSQVAEYLSVRRYYYTEVYSNGRYETIDRGSQLVSAPSRVSLDDGGQYRYLSFVGSLNILLDLGNKVDAWVGPGIGAYAFSGEDMSFSVFWDNKPTDHVIVGAPPSDMYYGLNLGVGLSYYVVPALSLGIEVRVHRVYDDGDEPSDYVSARILTLFGGM